MLHLRNRSLCLSAQLIRTRGFHYRSLDIEYAECIRTKDLTRSRNLQSLVISHGFELFSTWGGRLVRLFTLCGSFEEANRAFCKVFDPTISTWYAIIDSHVLFGECQKALELYGMISDTVMEPDKDIFQKILKACSLTGLIALGMQIHDQIITNGFEQSIILANSLIDMYGKCARVDEARDVFNRLNGRTVISWGSMIGGYIQNGHNIDALILFQDMQKDEHEPNSIVFTYVLKACDASEPLGQGRCIHHLAIKVGLESDTRVETGLINMYATAGSLEEAERIFIRAKCKDIKCWGAMISGYSQHGPNAVAFYLFEEMQQKGLRPDRVIYLSLLNVCQNMGSIKDGNLVHINITEQGLERNTVIGNMLISTYDICGSIEDAYAVFDQMPKRDFVSWTSIIAGCVCHECHLSALQLFGCMQCARILPDKVTYLWVLKSCGSLGDLINGRFINDQVLRQGLDSEIMVGCALIDMYGMVGSTREARTVFNGLPVKNTVSYARMISAYAQHGQDILCLVLFAEMLKDGIRPDESLCISLLRICARVGKIDVGMIVHDILKSSSSELNEKVVNALIDMYCKCDCISEASKLFKNVQRKSASCWSTMIAGYVDRDHIYPALILVEQMQQAGILPDKSLYVSICQAYRHIQDMKQGRIAHYLVIHGGFDSHLIIRSALIDMYSSCAYLDEAQQVFESCPTPDIVCWTALMSGYVQHGHDMIVIEIYLKLQDTGLDPDKVVFLCALKSCTIVGNIHLGRLLHQQIIECELEENIMIATALIDMYGKLGELKEGHVLLRSLKVFNAVTCGAIISNYLDHEHEFTALRFFETMKHTGMKPGIPTFLCVLKACSNIGGLQQGRIIHDQVVKCELEADIFVGNAIIDMYAKCGIPEEAHRVFDCLSKRDVISWTITIAAYASQGHWVMALRMLKSMEENGIEPDESMFITILSACSQNALLEEGFLNFVQMSQEYGLSPRIDHFNCIIDILGRGGHLNEAEDALKTIPVAHNFVGWGSLLTGCGLYGNKLLGGECFGEMKQLDCNHGSMLLS